MTLYDTANDFAFYFTHTAPSIAPQNFRNTTVTATSITFQWDNLTVREANGMIRNFTITCALGNSSEMVSVPIITNSSSSILYIQSLYNRYIDNK